jgi:hypothetical protein
MPTPDTLAKVASKPLRRSPVPARKATVSAARGGDRAHQRSSRQKIDNILRQRQRLVAEMRQLRDRGQASKFIDNAQVLLTRLWSPASWDARDELLKSADWLIRLERRSSQMRSSA